MISLTTTFLLIGIIVATSFYAWSRPGLQARLIMNPYRIQQHREYYRLLTSGFIHGGYIHLFFNVFTLYFFGTMMEQIFGVLFGSGLGTVYFLLLFMGGIVVSDIPTLLRYRSVPGYNSLGASGGVASLIFAFILFNPVEKLYILFIPIGIPGFMLGSLFLVYSYYQSKNSTDNINHSAHLYGALYGLVFSVLVQPSVLLRFVQALSRWQMF